MTEARRGSKSRWLILALVAVCASSSGCSSLWHDLQPHRLHRINRGPGMPTGADVYSVAQPTVAVRPS